MNTRQAKTLYLAILLVLFSLLACTIPGLGLTVNFTDPTATFTPIVTATPQPPVVALSLCVLPADCPDAHQIADYAPGELKFNQTTSVTIPVDDRILVNASWCASDQSTLEAGMASITYIFEINGVSYLKNAGIEQTYYKQDEASLPIPCVFIGIMLSDFKVGSNLQVRIGYQFSQPVSNGWSLQEPFSNVYILDLQPAVIPIVTATFTPSPTSTVTLTPTFTPSPWPTAYYTPTPVCQATGIISISNTTGGLVNLSLSGPAYYFFNLAAGDTTLSVCPGTYSFTAYGCGGATDTGTMSTGESHEFYCQ